MVLRECQIAENTCMKIWEILGFCFKICSWDSILAGRDQSWYETDHWRLVKGLIRYWNFAPALPLQQFVCPRVANFEKEQCGVYVNVLFCVYQVVVGFCFFPVARCTVKRTKMWRPRFEDVNLALFTSGTFRWSQCRLLLHCAGATSEFTETPSIVSLCLNSFFLKSGPNATLPFVIDRLVQLNVSQLWTYSHTDRQDGKPIHSSESQMMGYVLGISELIMDEQGIIDHRDQLMPMQQSKVNIPWVPSK